MTDGLKGVLAIIATSTIWGLSGMYYKLIAHVPPLEVLAHRTVWSLVFFLVVLLVQRRLRVAIVMLMPRRVIAVLLASALMISVNWFGFIYAISAGFATEASLGYYIFPLAAVALGYFFLGERFRPVQIVAIVLAVLAVLVLTIGLGTAPWIALMLATTFSLYGLLKRGIPIGPVVSVFGEVALLVPLALGFLFLLHGGYLGSTGAFGGNWQDSLLLAFSGILTGVPLVLFSYASKRLTYGTLGLVQYLNPTLQFLVAVLVFAEPFTEWHAIAFPLIWIGLALYSVERWRFENRARKSAIRAGTSVTTSK